jgi:hypothetical protein
VNDFLNGEEAQERETADVIEDSEPTDPDKNTIYPMPLDSDEAALVNLLSVSKSELILSASVNGSVHNMTIFVETYENGVLVSDQDALSFQLGNPVDIAILMNDFGNWDVNVRSGNGIISSTIDLQHKFDLTEDIFKFWTTLGFEVDLEKDVPQIIAVYYFDDMSTLSSGSSVFELNEIDNIEHYTYLYVMKVVVR